MSIRRLSISLESGLATAVAAIARRESRPVSNLIAVLLTEALRARAAPARPAGWPAATGPCPICGQPASETPPPGCPAHLV